ncbi:MAG: DNA-processing protein DprA [Candidatus Promineifilaceae bacterium]|nr:DNA-protecting protein DprA [Anaerolineaceae bacterium]
MSDLKYWLGFNLVKGIGPAKVQALLDYYGSLGDAWQANEFELVKIGFDKRALNTFLQTRQAVDLDAALAQVQRAGVSLLTWAMPEYPNYLREIPNPPPLLYYQGEILEQDRWAVAVVGTRRLTAYGRLVTRDLVAGLVQNNITVVSGLARGIDAIAHKTAVDLGGRTLAVLGSGLDCIYPADNRALAQEITQGQGAIISEYGLGVQPEAKNFPPRNRIISGLSLGVIIVEASSRSGALITTNFALEQNREIFAVPGNINSPASQGPNKLIQEGAKLVTKIEDVLEELNLHMVAERTAVQLVLPETAEEIALYSQLSGQPLHIDELSRATGLPSALVSSTLTLMELKGMVQQVGGLNYVLLREDGPIYNTTNTTESEDTV